MATKQTVPVTARALMQRINRKLAIDGKRLIANRGARAIEELGPYCVVSGKPGHMYVYRQNVDLQMYGRELGALAEWERLAEE
jgi:hypothetical protein